MKRLRTFTIILALAGTLLVLLPLVTPLLLGFASYLKSGVFRLDFLMPMELFPLVLSGGGLLVWVAWRTKDHLKAMAWALGIALLTLFGAQGLAVITGLASGDTPVGGWQYYLVLLVTFLYTLAVAALGAGGLLLLRDQFKPVLPQSEG